MIFFYNITAFVDSEIKDLILIKSIEKLIDCDCDVRREYYIQKGIKELLHKRFSCCCLPESVRQRFYKNISQFISKKIE